MVSETHELPPHAQRLRAARKARGWSLADASEGTGYAKSSWQVWESGVFPPADRALTIAAALGVTVEDIWGAQPLPVELPDDERPTLTPDPSTPPDASPDARAA